MIEVIKNRSEDTGKLVLRLTVAGLLLFHGVFKLEHGVEWMRQPLAGFGLPGFLAYGTFLAELFAPVLLILGVRTRLAALVIAFNMFMAIVLVLSPQVFRVREMGGGWGIELEAFFLLSAVALFFLGGGKFSIMKTPNAWD